MLADILVELVDSFTKANAANAILLGDASETGAVIGDAFHVVWFDVEAILVDDGFGNCVEDDPGEFDDFAAFACHFWIWREIARGFKIDDDQESGTVSLILWCVELRLRISQCFIHPVR